MEAQGERIYSSYSFTTSALDGSASRPSRTLPLGKGPTVPIVQKAGWAPETVWIQRLEEKSLASAKERISIVRSSSPQPDTELPWFLFEILNRLSYKSIRHFFRRLNLPWYTLSCIGLIQVNALQGFSNCGTQPPVQ
jgi:hypothetical protein